MYARDTNVQESSTEGKTTHSSAVYISPWMDECVNVYT